MHWLTWLKFYRYVGQWENYLLLARTWQAARLVRRLLKSDTPLLPDAIAAVNPLYLTPQAGWHLREPEKIYLFANFIVRLPLTLGRCVHRSLIVYRLLNGYGFPARLHYGIRRDDATQSGHAWVCLAGETQRAFGEAENPNERFLPVFTSEWNG